MTNIYPYARIIGHNARNNIYYTSVWNEEGLHNAITNMIKWPQYECLEFLVKLQDKSLVWYVAEKEGGYSKRPVESHWLEWAFKFSQ